MAFSSVCRKQLRECNPVKRSGLVLIPSAPHGTEDSRFMHMGLKKKLLLEALEDRNLLTVFGVPWPNGNQLTLSFEPDGTVIGGAGSTLLSSLDTQMGRNVWQKEILRAFQTWADVANINIGVVSDNGTPAGAPGAPTGSGAYGDIRIGGLIEPTGGVSLAETSPFSVLGGTWSGDSILNTAYAYSAGGSTTPFTYDLYTVYLQEAGHALGLGQSPDPTSVLFQTYQGPRAGLSPDDVAAIQGLYGARQSDQFEGTSGNDSSALATPLDASNGVSVQADISSVQDVDFYKLNGLQGNSKVAIRLETQGLSLFQGQITIFKDNNVIGTMSAQDVNQNLKFIIPNVDANAQYSVEVSAADSSVFGMGAYRLVVKPGSASDPGGDGPVSSPSSDNNNTFAKATSLLAQQITTSAGYTYSINASLGTPSDVDFYKIDGSFANLGRGKVMTVQAWTRGNKRVDPLVTVYDQTQTAVPAQVLVNQKGEYVLQIPNATSAAYYIKVQAAHPNADHATGAYFLGVQFSDNQLTPDGSISHSMTAASSSAKTTLTLTDTRLFYFALSGIGTSATDAVRLTIFDQNQNVVASWVARANDTTTAVLLLTPGSYTFGFGGGRTTGGSLSAAGFAFRLGFNVLSDPIDPDPSDPVGGGSGGSGNGTTYDYSTLDTTSNVGPPPPPPSP
jgi:Matrixin